MDIRFPREGVASLRDFVLRYLLITAAFLTRLTMRPWRDNRAQPRAMRAGEDALASSNALLAWRQPCLLGFGR